MKRFDDVRITNYMKRPNCASVIKCINIMMLHIYIVYMDLSNSSPWA